VFVVSIPVFGIRVRMGMGEWVLGESWHKPGDETPVDAG
jgi:hypothetical protein